MFARFSEACRWSAPQNRKEVFWIQLREMEEKTILKSFSKQ